MHSNKFNSSRVVGLTLFCPVSALIYFTRESPCSQLWLIITACKMQRIKTRNADPITQVRDIIVVAWLIKTKLTATWWSYLLQCDSLQLFVLQALLHGLQHYKHSLTIYLMNTYKENENKVNVFNRK